MNLNLNPILKYVKQPLNVNMEKFVVQRIMIGKAYVPHTMLVLDRNFLVIIE